MNYKQLLSAFIFTVMITISLSGQSESLEIDEALTLRGANSETPKKGTIRWNDGDFEGWNGFKWVSLTGSTSFRNYFSTVTDIDGNSYNTIRVGIREWMAENLRTTKYNDGRLINTYVLGGDPEDHDIHSWVYQNNHEYEEIFGRLYDWHAINYTGILGMSGLCPDGWHIPDSIEWKLLISNVEYSFPGNIGGALKHAGYSFWSPPNKGALNAIGFGGLPGGQRYTNFFVNIGYSGRWWNSDPYNALNAWTLELSSSNVDIRTGPLSKSDAYSVRCIKDNDH